MKKLITICAVIGLLLIVSANVKGTIDTRLLLHFDGINGDTNTVDSSGQGHSISLLNGAKLDTSTKAPVVGGTASLLLDGINDYGTSPDSADWDIFASTADNWTIDFYVKHNNTTGTQRYVSQGYSWYIDHGSGGLGFGGPIALTSAGPISDSEWHWIAFCKVGNTYAMYKDGNQINYLLSNATGTSSTYELTIGRNYNGMHYVNGHMDELRITHGDLFGAHPNSGLTDTIINIPEPMTIVLLGFGSLTLLRRKHRAKLN